MTTNSTANSYIYNDQLYLKATLQDTNLITSNNIINLTEAGTCTSSVVKSCVAETNLTSGRIVNPVLSARLRTKRTIKYGRVEVKARLPEGDWLWPAIWMMPQSSVYGAWPASGEIDIMESRGNNASYVLGGNNKVGSALHWGPTSAYDSWWRTNHQRTALHTSYPKKFHTFGLEWSEKYLFTYIDTRLLQVMYTSFKTDFWKRGQYPIETANGTRLQDPWSYTGNTATPFDQDFYLIINLAVGGTNGWFKDGDQGKPWDDASPTAPKQFWDARKSWLPTWKDGGAFVIDSVRMWQECG
jgi:beta-glucanase (GH16 family)